MEDYTAEIIKDMAFSFCPQCGTAIVPNHKGRPRKFCSPECRSKWNNTHPRPQNWKTVRSKVCPMCGIIGVLRDKGLLTSKECGQIEPILTQKFSPVWADLSDVLKDKTA